jgi:hypothetical protein
VKAGAQLNKISLDQIRETKTYLFKNYYDLYQVLDPGLRRKLSFAMLSLDPAPKARMTTLTTLNLTKPQPYQSQST